MHVELQTSGTCKSVRGELNKISPELAGMQHKPGSLSPACSVRCLHIRFLLQQWPRFQMEIIKLSSHLPCYLILWSFTDFEVKNLALASACIRIYPQVLSRCTVGSCYLVTSRMDHFCGLLQGREGRYRLQYQTNSSFSFLSVWIMKSESLTLNPVTHLSHGFCTVENQFNSIHTTLLFPPGQGIILSSLYAETKTQNLAYRQHACQRVKKELKINK